MYLDTVLRFMMGVGLRAWVTCVYLCIGVFTFNIETDYYVLHRGPPDSKFGFSVAQHRDTQGSWVLVGAPEAETLQPEIDKGGAVYRCHPAIPDDCEAINFDPTGNHWEAGRQVDNKSMQWFGASVSSKSGVIVACAPRYVWFSVKKNRREPVGNCFISTGRDSQTYQLYSPCMTILSLEMEEWNISKSDVLERQLNFSAWGYHRQGSCQAGFGTALTQNGNRLYVGAVGSFYWQGQVFYQSLLNRQEALATPEGPQRDDMSYLGYSVAAGDFNGDGEEDIAVGMPRGHQLTGQVVLFDDKLTVLYNITGDQIGSYFGYSVAVCDVNGDGLGDIAVGAPWHTHEKATNEFEVGQVTIFMQTPQHNFQRSVQLSGQRSRSHFGISVTCLGDLNHDQYQDLAVGAPYDGEKGGGAVHIFLGGPKGLVKEPSQVLMSEKLARFDLSTFGWSLSGGEDLDGNQYPDLVVGAYTTNKAVVFRTRPVVRLNATLKFRSERGIIDLDDQDCKLLDGAEVPCVSLQYCLEYSGHGVPKNLRVQVMLRLDTQVDLSRRMFFLTHEQNSTKNITLDLRNNVNVCKSVYTYVSAEPRDKLTPLVADLGYRLVHDDPALLEPGEYLRPMLAPSSALDPDTHKASIYIKNNCGNDNVCVPDLRTDVKAAEDEYILGSTNNINVTVKVRNDGEDAFLSLTKVKVPRGVSFSKFIIHQNSAPDVTPICSANTKSDQETVKCEIGNPLPAGGRVSLELIFQPNPESINDTALEFHVTTTSANQEEEDDLQDNHFAFALPVTVKSIIDIKGISWPDGPFDYNISRFGVRAVGEGGRITHEREIGPEVMHVYDITNRGPSHLPSAQIYLLWPTRTLSGDPLLYLLDPPQVSDRATCIAVPDVNYLDITVEDSSYDHLVATPSLAADEGEGALTPEEHLRSMVNDQHHQHHRRRRHNNNNHHNHHHHHHMRRRRKNSNLGARLEEELECGPTNCTRVLCSISPFRAKENVVLRVRSRLWVDTVEKLGMAVVKISSRVVIVGGEKGVVEGDESEGEFVGHIGGLWSGSVTTVVRTGPEERARSLKWVVIVGSILAGLLLLALLTTILWAMGFFKRKRPQDKTENEPLNSNGYYGNGKS